MAGCLGCTQAMLISSNTVFSNLSGQKHSAHCLVCAGSVQSVSLLGSVEHLLMHLIKWGLCRAPYTFERN
jgi:hypothetical protein